jgi:hypothetical protein
MNKTRVNRWAVLAGVLMALGQAVSAPPGGGGQGQGAEVPKMVRGVPYEKKATREETFAAMLAKLYPEKAKWGTWQLLSAWDFAKQGELATKLPPEEELTKMEAGGTGPDLKKTYTGKVGATVAWKDLGDISDRNVPLGEFVPGGNDVNSVSYLYVRVDAEEATTADVAMGSDDGLRFWLNGKLLVDDDQMRGLDPGNMPSKLKLKFEKGANHILAKVSNGKGMYEFRIDRRPPLDAYSDALLQYHLDADFPPTDEGKYYRSLPLFVPDDVVLEVGGLHTMPDGRPIVSTRRGDVYIIDNAYAQPAFDCKFIRFATGLHEPLGLQVRREKDATGKDVTAVYCVQRGELTRLVDTTGDDIADVYQTYSDGWGVSGNYHEFAFGPKFDRAGNAWVTLNVGFCGSLGKSMVPWRGWALKVDPKGQISPVCDGLRSPNGIGEWSDGTMFYLDNQGDYVGTNRMSPLLPGSYAGHPASVKWRGPDQPGKPEVTPATIWFPYRKMGQSSADFLLYGPNGFEPADTPAGVSLSNGAFGPFEGQVFVGDQTLCMVNRVTIEKIEGVYQGACYPFRSGLQCGVNRLAWGKDGSMFVGQTDRGWGSIGRRRYGVERIVWTGEVPFELKEMKVAKDGFTLEFTKDLDAASAGEVASYGMVSYTYLYHATYGSPEVETQRPKIAAAAVTGKRTVKLTVQGLREGGQGFVHELTMPGVRSAGEGAKQSVVHPVAYYTLQRLPK